MGEDKRWSVMPGLGGLFLLVCFFLPWLEVSCAGQTVVQATASELAQGVTVDEDDASAPYLWLLLPAGVLGVASFFVASAGRSRAAARVAVAAAVGTLILLVVLYLQTNDSLAEAKEEVPIAVHWQVGAIGTFLGALLMGIGGALGFLGKEKT